MVLILDEFLPQPRRLFENTIQFSKSGYMSATKVPVLSKQTSECVPCVSDPLLPPSVTSALILSLVLLTLLAIFLISKLQTKSKFRRKGSITRSDTLVPVLITVIALPILVSLLYKQLPNQQWSPKALDVANKVVTFRPGLRDVFLGDICATADEFLTKYQNETLCGEHDFSEKYVESWLSVDDSEKMTKAGLQVVAKELFSSAEVYLNPVCGEFVRLCPKVCGCSGNQLGGGTPATIRCDYTGCDFNCSKHSDAIENFNFILQQLQLV